jgi:hypothetical protein
MNELDYVDDEGIQWVMCACGHHAGGGVAVGDKIALCPNCMFLARFQPIPVVYSDRLPDTMKGETPHDQTQNLERRTGHHEEAD